MASDSLEADYIVIGGGLTGCAVASRLREYKLGYKVILLEAGPDASSDPRTRDLGGAFALAGTELDYNYSTVPQKNTNERSHNITGGKVLGGSSILNYGGWTRGNAADYDSWGRKVDDAKTWSYQGFLPHLKKAENHYAAEHAPDQRGSDGPLHVTSVEQSDPKRKYGLREPIKQAWCELGLSYNDKGDCGTGRGISEYLENFQDGQRQASNLAYDLKDVQVITNAPVHKILLEDPGETGDHPVASAVMLIDGQQFKARKEVVISAGALRTPQILMLSGIGPPELLKQHGIDVLAEHPEVGRNYFDHFAHFQVWKLKNPEKGLSMGSAAWNDNPALYKGLPCDWTVTESLPPHLVKLALEKDVANRMTEGDESLLDPTRTHVETLVLYSPLGAPVPVDGSYIATSVMLLVPTSRGSVTIASASPTDNPIIDPNYYETEFDRQTLVYGTRRVASTLLTTEEGKRYVEMEITVPGVVAVTADSSDEMIDSRIRASGTSHAHSAGTAAMGKVVDTHFRVKGIQGLRVVDASIFPVAIGGHPQATLYGIAEKAAEMIVNES